MIMVYTKILLPGLDAVYGEDNYVAVRPGRFATNLNRYKGQIQSGQVYLFGGDFVNDFTTARDMGGVSGSLLVNGPKDGQKKVYVYAPQILSTKKGLEIVAKELGKDVNITSIDAEAGVKQMTEMGFPEHLAQYMANIITAGGEKELLPERDLYKEGVANVKKYTGQEGQPFEDWVKETKDFWAS
jgi:hypothetical protein